MYIFIRKVCGMLSWDYIEEKSHFKCTYSLSYKLSSKNVSNGVHSWHNFCNTVLDSHQTNICKKEGCQKYVIWDSSCISVIYWDNNKY